MGAVVVLTILATLVCGGGVYTAFSGKLDDGGVCAYAVV